MNESMKLDLSEEIMLSLTYMACYTNHINIFDFIQSKDSEMYTFKTFLIRLYNNKNIFVNSIIKKINELVSQHN